MKEQDLLLMEITGTLSRVARAYKTAADKVAAQYGLSQATAWPAVVISRMKNGVRPGEVADAMGMDPSSVVRVIDHLIAADLLVREEDPNDRRARTLTLTEDGRERVRQISETMRPFRRELFKDIDPSELKTCLKVLEKLGQSVKLY